MVPNWQTVTGVVKRGHQIASGQAENSPYPNGSIAIQMPVFQALGLALSDCFPGTLNVTISPYTFVLKAPVHTFRQVQWTPYHSPEHFSFSPCWLKFDSQQYDGWVYYPHPETKRRHFQDASTLEILAPRIPNIQYGDRLELAVDPQQIDIIEPSARGE